MYKEKLSKGDDDPFLSVKIEGKEKKLQNRLQDLEVQRHNNPLAELTDILEAVYRMAELRGCKSEELDKIRCERSSKFGKFDKNMFLDLDETIHG